MTVVVDASVVVAAFADGGATGEWAEQILASDHIAAPHLLPAEVANILRRASAAGDLEQDSANLAYADAMQLPTTLFPFEPFADRVWEIRGHITSYDAWYVALAEELGAELATLDKRLTRAGQVHCEFLTPPGQG